MTNMVQQNVLVHSYFTVIMRKKNTAVEYIQIIKWFISKLGGKKNLFSFSFLLFLSGFLSIFTFNSEP